MLAKNAFPSSWNRVLFYFVVCHLILLPLSFYFPLLLLVLNPLFFGMPHLISGLRFQFSSCFFAEEKKTLLWTSLLAWFVFIALQILAHYAHLGDSLKIKLNLVVFILFVPFILKYDEPLPFRLLRFLGLLGLALAFWNNPLQVAGLFILAHHFVAFFNWVIQAQEGKSRNVALTALGIFTLVHVFCLLGYFDSLMSLKASSDQIFNWPFSINHLGSVLMPETQDPSLLYRLVCLWAYGQSLHYIVWLQFIPYTQNKISPFDWSRFYFWEDITKSLGGPAARFSVAGSLFLILIFAIKSPEMALLTYSAIAGFHTYYEFSVIGAQRWARSNKESLVLK